MNGTCHYCGAEATTKDHVIPRALAGPNRQWNLVPCCEPCNNAKAAQTYEDFTGRDRLPWCCAEVGFSTTASFELFVRQLRSIGGTYLILPAQRKPKESKPKPVVDHPAWVNPCIHEGACRGQDGCLRRRTG